MRKIIKDKTIVNDDWQLVKLAEGEAAETLTVPTGKTIVPLQVWLAQKSTLASRTDIGVWLASDERAESLKEDIATLPLIAIDFPTFADGLESNRIVEAISASAKAGGVWKKIER